MDVFCLRNSCVVSEENHRKPSLSVATFSPKLIYNSAKKRILPNAIAFDLDETIGSFSDFHSIWARLENHMKTQQVFNDLMELYPEFLRVGIFSIFRYIRTKQESGHCLPIYIYTNNQCEDMNWIYQLIHYIEFKISPKTQYQLFARPICAFKIRGKRIELNRTTHEKTYSDFVKCSMLTSSHELCFIDDICHQKMKNKRVYYIQPPPYVHPIHYREVVDRFFKSDVYKRLYPDRPVPFTFDDKPYYALHNHPPSPHPGLIAKTHCEEDEHNITNRIMYYIREFFTVSTRKCATKKRQPKIGNFSRKRYKSRKL